ncbi:hypothetical protein P153DRAFT_396065 [Dothidotthia symphoricarpi CBS 119687]|uniref:BTB domain-containing protein n=1 Tax=Dothidotthia symphoricarpi CBS 119687 TaxID=1392245 RepID=A0A6A6AGY9_9PLEO|nr:uncharacterized protein P153DRAFT_396065 [Dothidotthia symphoricarpi CBS 119687]KAF2129711.1 hypothetical protein P153DRAFT_396065 [Dothidotthia symphoricarpi CBS 119687]
MAKKKERKGRIVKTATDPELAFGEIAIVEDMPTPEETHVVEKTSAVEKPLAKSNSRAHPRPQRPRTSPYTSCRVVLHIGPNAVVHYVPKDFVHFPQWVKPNRWGEIALPDVDTDTGHTLVHYLHTGTYQTLNNGAFSPKEEARAEFKRALSTYVMTITYDLLDLQLLTMREMEDQGAQMDIFEMFEAIKEDFAKLDPTTWFYEYLHRKARAAFEEDHTVFTKNVFLESLNNAALNKFMLICVVKLYDDKVSRMLATDIECSRANNRGVQQTIPEQGITVYNDDVVPLAHESSGEEPSIQEGNEQPPLSMEESCASSSPFPACPMNVCAKEIISLKQVSVSGCLLQKRLAEVQNKNIKMEESVLLKPIDQVQLDDASESACRYIDFQPPGRRNRCWYSGSSQNTTVKTHQKSPVPRSLEQWYESTEEGNIENGQVSNEPSARSELHPPTAAEDGKVTPVATEEFEELEVPTDTSDSDIEGWYDSPKEVSLRS